MNEAFIRLLLPILREEFLPVGDDGVHVSLSLNGYVKSTVPFIHLDIQLDGSIEELGLEENLLRLLDFLAVDRESCVPSRFTW